MKPGDLVVMRLPYEDIDEETVEKMGLIIGGPRDGYSGDTKVHAYEVMWLDIAADNIGWHGEPNLEVISESR
jgi:hypothetical protein